jgi:ferredoxin-NADP reductase
MLRFIDDILNKITMYRFTLYYLTFLILIAGVFSLFGLMPFKFLDLAISVALLTAVAWVANNFFSYIFRAPTNVESVYITAFILALIILPGTTVNDYIFLASAATIAMASKYILAFQKKHIFNPTALSVVATLYIMQQSASWWVGNIWMLAPVVLGGLLVARKIRRGLMVTVFLLTVLALTVYAAVMIKADAAISPLKQLALYSPLFFFAFVMFTEPSTTPPTRSLQLAYAVLIGILFAPFTHIGNFYFLPEQALLIGNVFSFLVSPKYKLVLGLKEKKQLAPGIYEFVFGPDRKVDFKAGQYLEWTKPHSPSDTRGNRRYFTIASSPTENDIHLGVRFYEPSSSYKKSLQEMKVGEKLVAGQLSGDFVLPQDKSKKLVFIAGGIGITPFRSMIKYLLDQNEKRDVVLIYSNETEDEVAYRSVFDDAARKGMKVVYFYSKQSGRLNPEKLKQEVPDLDQRHFYISGSHGFVAAVEDMLHDLGVPRSKIKTDFFPGYA